MKVFHKVGRSHPTALACHIFGNPFNDTAQHINWHGTKICLARRVRSPLIALNVPMNKDRPESFYSPIAQGTKACTAGVVQNNGINLSCGVNIVLTRTMMGSLESIPMFKIRVIIPPIMGWG